MKNVERKVFLVKPDRNKEPVAYVNIPSEVKQFYCHQENGAWIADKVRVIFDERTGVLVVLPKWINENVSEIVEKATVQKEGSCKEENGKGDECNEGGKDSEKNKRSTNTLVWG